MTPPRPGSPTIDAETLLAHSAWLSRFARALVARDSEIDDVVQQTYARALAQPPQHAGNLRGWLATIARNIVRTNARGDAARVAREVAVPLPSPVESPVEAVERAELRRLVVESVLALDEPYRSAVVLRFFEEQDVATVARLTRAPEDTVRTRIRRGVLRVRELLERKVDDRSRGSADEGAAARAILLVRLREIAANGHGGSGSAGVPRDAVRTVGTGAVASSTRRAVVAAATVAVVGLVAWWWMGGRRDLPTAAAPVASRGASASGDAEPAATAPAAAERLEDRPPPPPSTTPPTKPPSRGSIRGIVTDFHGNPVVGADVWAIPLPDYEPAYTMDTFTPLAKEQAEKDPRLHCASEWIRTKTGDGGRYEFSDLSTVPAWSLGAYEAKTGARITDPRRFDRDRRELVADVELMEGNVVRGVVRDRDGQPIGNARVFVHVTYGEKTTRTTVIANPSGPNVGEFDAGFRCGDAREIECNMPGFLPIGKKKIDVLARVDEMELTVVLDRAPGRLLRGRLVDPTGLPVALETILERHFAINGANQRSLKTSVWAIASGVKPPPLLAGTPTGPEIVEGRIDFVANTYEFVLPGDFRGSLQLQLSKYVVGTAPLGDLSRAPDLACDDHVLPPSMNVRTIAVKFIDAESKEPIDLRGEQLPPTAMDPTGTYVPLVKEESDLEHGLVLYRCSSASFRLDPYIEGYAFGARFVDLPESPAASPLVIEVSRAAKMVHGFAHRADGRPLAHAALSIYRPTGEGFVDATTQRTVTSGDGEFEFSGLAKGEHVVVVSGEPGETPAVARFVASDQVSEVALTTSVGVTTSFKIVAKAGDPDWKIPYFCIADRDGLILFCPRYDWPKLTSSNDAIVLSLVPGHYRVVVEPPRFLPSRIEFDVPAPGPIEIPVEPKEAPKK